MNKVRIQKLGEQVVRQIGARIVQGEYSETRELPSELEISEEFQVSRTVAREVVSTLVSLGLIQKSQGRRMTLRPRTEWDYLNPLLLEFHSPEDVRRILGDLHDLRLLLEPEIAARAATQIAPDRVASMEAAVQAMKLSTTHPAVYLEHDLAFHMQLAWACNNVVLSSVLRSISGILFASLTVTTLVPSGLQTPTADHEKILEAVAAGDPGKARHAMQQHLEFTNKVWRNDAVPIEFGVQPRVASDDSGTGSSLGAKS